MMDELQMLLSKLDHSQQQRVLDFENSLAATVRRDENKSLQKKLNLLEATVEDQLNTQMKADTNNKHLLESLRQEAEIKRSKLTANNNIIEVFQEELSHLNMVETLLTEEQNCEPVTNHLEEEEAMSVRWLALEIKKVTGGWLQFVFTNISRQNPDSPYVFSLRIDEDRKYKVGDCHPVIRDMDVLVEKLNSSNNLSTFVRSVRKRFASMASK